MPSDQYGPALRELEAQLVAQDAEFVQRFRALAQPAPPQPRVVGGVQLAGMLLFAALMLLAGSLAGAVAFTAAAVTIGLARWYLAADPVATPPRDLPD